MMMNVQIGLPAKLFVISKSR